MLQKISSEKEDFHYQQSTNYTNLINSFCDNLKSAGKSQQILKNVRSSLTSWQNSLSTNSTVGKEFLNDFNNCLKKYINSQKIRGIKESTYNTRLTHIKNCRRFYLQQTELQFLPQSFEGRLQYLLKINGYTIRHFWKLHLANAIVYETLVQWVSKRRRPSSSNYYVIELIEQNLRVKPGTLIDTLLPPTKKSSFSGLPYSVKLSVSYSKPYFIWTETLASQFQDLLKFKTAIIPSNHMQRYKTSVWTGGTEQFAPPTGQFVKNDLSAFFGFCCLSPDSHDPMLRGLGMKPEDLTFALLADCKILEKFITEFKLARAGGKYNNSVIHFISVITSLLRKNTGYLYQKPEIRVQDKTINSTKEWQKKCLFARQRLLDIQKFIDAEKRAGGENFELGRDPQEPIRAILEQPHPLAVLMQMTVSMAADVEKLTRYPKRQAILFRDMLLITMLQANPLRVNMFRIMKLNEHLVKAGDGSWWLKFKRKDFKNRSTLNSDYAVMLSPDIWQMINIFIDKHRPLLNKGINSDYVFFSSEKRLSGSEQKQGILKNTLYQIVKHTTRQYIPESNGFGPHAFRHIIATDIIKSDPTYGFFLAANMLHDKIETVKNNYAHLEANDFVQPYNNHFSKLLKTVGTFELKS